jgi:hypothetical protein
LRRLKQKTKTKKQGRKNIMVDAAQIKDHTEVVGSDGAHVGTVDHMEGGNRIKLTRRDPNAGGEHHYIPLEWVDSVEGDRVRLNKTGEEAKAQWQGDSGQSSTGTASM